MTPVYKELANAILARKNCKEHNNEEWYDRWDERIEKLMATAPSGSGFDSGTELCENSSENRLIFLTAYHHTSEVGFYTHWTHHRVTVSPSLWTDFTLTVSKKWKEEEVEVRVSSYTSMKEKMVTQEVDEGFYDYVTEVFDSWLSEEWKRPEGW